MFDLKRDLLQDLSKDELIDLIDKYDTYIIGANQWMMKQKK